MILSSGNLKRMLDVVDNLNALHIKTGVRLAYRSTVTLEDGSMIDLDWHKDTGYYVVGCNE